MGKAWRLASFAPFAWPCSVNLVLFVPFAEPSSIFQREIEIVCYSFIIQSLVSMYSLIFPQALTPRGAPECQRKEMKLPPLAVPFSLLTLSFKAVSPTVMGIDYGSQLLKISYASAPGEGYSTAGVHDALPIVSNKLSERSTLNAVSFRGDTEFFGPEAIKPFLNQPERAYNWLSRLVGSQFDAPETQRLLSTSGARWEKEPTRGTILVTAAKGELVPVEYLSATLLSRAKEWAEAQSNRAIKDVVITIPPFLNQAQRQAVIDTANIAGLNVLSLVHDISSAAILYGATMVSKNSEGRHIVLLDSGATHSAASLVYIEPNHTEDSSTAVLISVKRTVWDMELCGYELDKAIASLLEKKFEITVPKGKPLNRLLTKAGETKKILSANTAIIVSIEELVGEANFSTRLSREEFEAFVPHLHNRASSMINKLLIDTGLGIADIHSIIPVGSNSRVPFVQEDLRRSFGGKLQFVLNMEEAAARGAAFYAAALSHFRVKPIRFRDVYPQTIDFHYGDQQNVVIYPSFSQLDGHRGVAFKNMESLRGIVSSSDQGNIMSLSVSGMQAALSQVADKTIVSSKLKFWVDLTTSGTVVMKDGPVALIKHEEIATDLDTLKATNDTHADRPNETPVPVKQLKTISLPLEYSVTALYPHLTMEEIASWAAKITAAKELERRIMLRSEQRNNVEAKLYELTEYLETKKYGPFAQAEELNRLMTWLKSAGELLEEPEDSHTIDDYSNFLADVLSLEGKIQTRSREHQCRQNTAQKLRKAIEDVLLYVLSMRRDFPDAASRAQTDEDLLLLESAAKDIETWYQDLAGKQDRLTQADDPVLLCASMENRLQELQRQHMKIVIKRPLETKPPKNTTTGEPAGTSNTTDPPKDQREPSGPSAMQDPEQSIPNAQPAADENIPEDKMEL